MKAATIALIVRAAQDQSPEVVEVLSDNREIQMLEEDMSESNPLRRIHEHRDTQAREDADFADYVEDLLSQPFLKPEIQAHGVQWLKSKIRIEQYQKSEAEAAHIIAEYAIKVYAENPERRDFFLAGPKAQVRVRVFVVCHEISRAA